MKRIGRLNLKDLSGKRLQRPEMKFLVGGYGEGGYGGDDDDSSKKKYKICCLPTPVDGTCTKEFRSDVCDGDLCGDEQNYSCI
jgi:natural product precursor